MMQMKTIILMLLITILLGFNDEAAPTDHLCPRPSRVINEEGRLLLTGPLPVSWSSEFRDSRKMAFPGTNF